MDRIALILGQLIIRCEQLTEQVFALTKELAEARAEVKALKKEPEPAE